MGAAESIPGKFTYRRHEPEKTLLYQKIASSVETWLEERQADTSRTPLPQFIEREFRGFLRCGLPQYGFLMIECPTCKSDVPVAFSCKKRGFCPSCGAKRQAEVTLHMIDHVLPVAAYRQWVVTFPYQLRFWMATNRQLTNVVHKIVADEIMAFYEHQAERRGVDQALSGGSTFIQRFGSAANLNVHFHTIVVDGVFSVAGGEPVYYQLAGPKDDDVAAVVNAIAEKIIAALRKRNYLPAEGADSTEETTPPLDRVFAESEQLTEAASASNVMKIAFGERAGQPVRRIGRTFGYVGEVPLIQGKRCASMNGFTVHANRYIGEQERQKLQELVSYAARPAISNKLLSLADPENPDGDLLYELKTPWRDGTTAVQLSPGEFLEKLSALMPPPYMHMSRHFGVFSSHSQWRSKIILKPHIKKGFVAATDGSVVRLTWSLLLKRTFKIDMTRCQACGARVFPEHGQIIEREPLLRLTLVVLGLDPDPPPIRAAQVAPLDLEFDQRTEYDE